MKAKAQVQIYFAIGILLLISTASLYNAKYLNIIYKYYYVKQLIWFLCGLIICLFLSKQKLTNLYKYSKYLYWANNLLLLFVLIFGKPINGTRAWFNLGPFSLQPSEFMKVSLPLYLLSIADSKEKKFKSILKMFIYTLIPSILVFLEPDTGAIIFYLLTFIFIISYKKINPSYYFLLFGVGVALLGIFFYYYFTNPDVLIKTLGTSFFYRAERVIDFRNNNYQLELALISIFSSGLLRNGFNNLLLYIPEGPTDFIFAFTVGNFGLIVIPIIFVAYYLLINNLLKLVNKFQSKKTNYLVISFILMLLMQIAINILMNVGLIPIVGITLPFISYGGSSLLAYFIYLGIILSLTQKRK